MMRTLKIRQVVLLLYRLLVPVSTWSLTASLAWAQVETQSGTETKSYVLPYLMVILIVALGLLIVLRSAGRASDVTKVKQEE